MRVLIYGAGVIGSLYAAKLAMHNHDVTILARGKRLEELQTMGLVIHEVKNNRRETVRVRTIDSLQGNDIYDYIFIVMRNDQVNSILPILKENKSPNIVFMVNNASGPSEWIHELGRERVILAFPGAGGKREEGVIYYNIVSRLIQPTTIGELEGAVTHRINELCTMLRESGFPVAISNNMDAWLKCHLAMVTPMANVIYFVNGDNYKVANDRKAIALMNLAIKESFQFLKTAGYQITPWKMKIFLITPLWILNVAMRLIFNTKWAETVVASHAITAKPEMDVLTQEFVQLAKKSGFEMKYFNELISTGAFL